MWTFFNTTKYIQQCLGPAPASDNTESGAVILRPHSGDTQLSSARGPGPDSIEYHSLSLLPLLPLKTVNNTSDDGISSIKALCGTL